MNSEPFGCCKVTVIHMLRQARVGRRNRIMQNDITHISLEVVAKRIDGTHAKIIRAVGEITREGRPVFPVSAMIKCKLRTIPDHHHIDWPLRNLGQRSTHSCSPLRVKARGSCGEVRVNDLGPVSLICE